MAKRLKLRIFRLIPIFQSCRSKDPSALPLDPHPIFFRHTPTTTANNNKIDIPATVHGPPPPPPKPHHSSLKRHVSSAFISVGCGFGSRSSRQQHSSSDEDAESAKYKWKQDDKWHVIARVQDDAAPLPRRKIQNSSVSSGTDADVSPSPPLPAAADLNKNKRSNKRKKCKPRVRISTSSGDSGWFSSEGGEDNDDDDGEETETLVSSSRSITTDCSSDFNPHLETISESPTDNESKPKKNKKKYPPKRVRRLKRKGADKGKTCPSPGTETTPARLSVFQRMIPCTMDGKVRESFAIIKRSEDPYEDFKRSMLEMIVEKQMFEESDLEQLLHCFLSLNSRQHHGVIVEAFSEIWENLFCKSPGPGPNPNPN